MVKSVLLMLGFMTTIALIAIISIIKFATEMNDDIIKSTLHKFASEMEFTKATGVIRLRSNNSHIASNRFPFLVAITAGSRSKAWSFSCFGCIVGAQWIITAAHCKKPDHAHRVFLYYDYMKNRTKIYPVILWKVHEDFNPNSTLPKYDIAVAKLGLNGQTAFADAAVLSKSRPKQVQASVWKTVIAMDRTTYLTNVLDIYDVTLAEEEQCYNHYGIHLDESLFCVDMSSYTDCFVTEFGPVFAKKSSKIAGVLTTVQPKDCNKKVAVFTNVSSYVDWIVKATKTIDESSSVLAAVKVPSFNVPKMGS